MANDCKYCGKPLKEGERFCIGCGKPIDVSPTESNAAHKEQPSKTAIQAETNVKPINTVPNKGGFLNQLFDEIKDLLKHPKKLLPTIILSVVWVLFSILSTVGVNIPIFRFLYTLTYSNGGMFGGFFGAIGGIFGKVVFATVINTIVLSLFAKKNPFANAAKSLTGVFGKAAFSGLSAISPFLIGAGAGLVLYWFFNITSSPVNCAVAVVGAVGAFSAIGKKKGLLVSLIFSAAGKVSRGKLPSQVVVNRAITGFSAGFAIGLPLTFVRFGWLLFLIGAIILAAGIVFAIIGKNGIKKMAATAAMFILTSAMMISVLCTNVFAADETLPNGYVPMGEVFRLADGDGSQPYNYKKVDGFYLVLDHMTSYGIGLYGDDAVYGTKPSINETYQSAEQTISDKPAVTFTHDQTANGFTVSGSWKWKHAYTGEAGSVHKAGENEVFRSDVTLTISNISFEDCHVYADLQGRLNASGGHNDSYDKESSYNLSARHAEGNYKFDSENETVYIAFYVGEAGASSTHASLVFRIAGVLPNADAGVVGGSAGSEQSPDDDSDVRPYRGRLTYTNGRVNKHGQPFPDLMDFDGDGEITWLDMNIQKELSHDPDWLDRPTSKALGVLLAILTGLLGAGGGLVGGIAGGLAGGLGSAAGEAVSGLADGISEAASENEKEDLGPYINRDADGDLNVKDPATGEERVYVANGDGTYTNPLTGATYTESELKDSLESRAENADLIRQDNAVAKEAIDAQREDNQGKSWIAEEAEAENAAQRAKEAAEADQNKYKEKLADKYGVYSGDDDLYAKIGEKQGQAEIERYEQGELEKEYKKSQDYVENVKKGADIAIDIYAEVDPTQTGKKFKDAYTVATAAASNAGDVMAGYKTVGGAIVQTAVDSGVELAKNHSEGVTQKLASNIMGDSVKAMSDTYMKGGSVEDIRQAGEGAAIQGGVNAAVDIAFDAFGDKATEKLGLTGDKVVGSIGGQQITKGMTGGAAKVVANTGVKDMLTPKDSDEVKLEKLQEAQEKAENEATAEAAKRFREAQKEWSERNKE